MLCVWTGGSPPQLYYDRHVDTESEDIGVSEKATPAATILVCRLLSDKPSEFI